MKSLLLGNYSGVSPGTGTDKSAAMMSNDATWHDPDGDGAFAVGS